MKRRAFLTTLAAAAAPPRDYGTTLIHEHILVDFIGADQVSPSRYNVEEVIRVALPKLRDLKERGCKTLVECTPAYLGRDPGLLRKLSAASGIQILTNTGWYGANKDKHLPKEAWTYSPDQIADRWTREFRHGISDTKVIPAFQKIGVDSGPLSEVDRKLIVAGCLCHKATGLRMHVHTGDGKAAMDIISEIRKQGLPPSIYVWVHAQNEKDRKVHEEAGKAGVWLEFDGINKNSLELHINAVQELTAAGYGKQLLISQDSGWYRVGEPGGGTFNGYTYLFDEFLPALKKRGATESQIEHLLVTNPGTVLKGS
ncbi:MAG: phosphotriesterase [Bryobacteraceae bacterium]|nr:phosphotriesterase [Bryobacteraceae bacterium]